MTEDILQVVLEANSIHGSHSSGADGFLDQHFRCSDEHLDLEKVIWAFTLYLRGDERWRTEFSWEQGDL